MTSVITSIVDQLTGRSRIPASAAPVTQPSFAQLPTGGKKRKPGRRDGRARTIAALDRNVGRTAVELADLAGISANIVRDHMPKLLKEGIARAERGVGSRAPRRFWRAG